MSTDKHKPPVAPSDGSDSAPLEQAPQRPPPTGYSSWLDFAVETFDTRGPWVESLLQDPVEANREAMREAARTELGQLKTLARKDRGHPADKATYTGPEIAFGPAVGAERFWEEPVLKSSGFEALSELPAPTTFDVSLNGHRWTPGEARARHDELPAKIEMVGGRLFLSHEDRVNVLAALLEHLGPAVAVRIGDPAVWKEAVRGLDVGKDHS